MDIYTIKRNCHSGDFLLAGDQICSVHQLAWVSDMSKRRNRLPKRYCDPYLQQLYGQAARYFKMRLERNALDAGRLRRSLIRRIGAMATRSGASEEHWLLLADLYSQLEPRSRCLTKALLLAPQNPEAHAELAGICAARKQKDKALRHASEALQRCRGHPLEELILENILQTAHQIHDEHLAKHTLRVAQRRFPKSVFFTNR